MVITPEVMPLDGLERLHTNHHTAHTDTAAVEHLTDLPSLDGLLLRKSETKSGLGYRPLTVPRKSRGEALKGQCPCVRFFFGAPYFRLSIILPVLIAGQVKKDV
jgi:hypothetical protein